MVFLSVSLGSSLWNKVLPWFWTDHCKTWYTWSTGLDVPDNFLCGSSHRLHLCVLRSVSVCSLFVQVIQLNVILSSTCRNWS